MTTFYVLLALFVILPLAGAILVGLYLLYLHATDIKDDDADPPFFV